MRPIKFRAWDNEIKEMLEMVTVACHRKDPWPPLYIADGIINGIDHQDYVLMQYTGLKDKNGKEIYEGDIVNLTHMVYAGYGNVDEVTEAVVIEDITKLPFGPSTITCEVIGNIFEDKHLLKEESK